jgi:hypothetical protein
MGSFKNWLTKASTVSLNAGLFAVSAMVSFRSLAEMKMDASGSPRKFSTMSSTGSGACIVMADTSAPVIPSKIEHTLPANIFAAMKAATRTS